jgi:tRNA pseudouridine38-40 synthase
MCHLLLFAYLLTCLLVISFSCTFKHTTEQYRLSDNQHAEVNNVFKLYLGTHNYHNFTSGKKFVDPSAKRYIMSMECGKPFVKDDHEFCVITVKGQSFMLHQIRKMIGMAIAVVRGCASRESLEKCWTAHKVSAIFCRLF